MPIPRWRNVLLLKNSVISSSSTATHFASFHSTPISCEKWRKKWDFDAKGCQQPSKNYIRYATRQKRADAKKALKDLLYRNGSSKFSFQDEDPVWKPGGQPDKSDNSRKKYKPKYWAQHADKSHQKKIKRKFRRDGFNEDFNDHHETIFQATFGNRWYTWSFNLKQESFFKDTESEFDWRERLNWKHRSKTLGSSSDSESDDESYSVGLCSDRTVLGLPPTGPLKLEDVKKAFRLSALKWHPDKHQGPSQAMAEEKFKLCVDAYNSLCKVLSPA
ncbi:DnaJ domain containing protein [Trema orientale]|uniref:DnaJ domain containing protein n=1 Tax=Trema orientale TaxID=63057 RepID=A0A2P5ED75_TREOI|nr:DnaJ domain containing protein [Trema orientale]